MQLNYHLLDVFTDTQFTGNPLAIVTKADLLNTEIMQRIAREFALSETVFVSQPITQRNTAKIRIFTPYQELSFAGHPTIGTAVLLGLTQRSTAIRLEEGIGVITCVMDKLGKKLGQAHFSIPQLPEETGAAPDSGAIAKTLGLSEEQIGCDVFEPARFSSGLEFTLVPVRDHAALASIKLERRGWADTYGEGHRANVFGFTINNDRVGADFSARMFDPKAGEDPATGSAAAALIGLLAKNLKAETVQHNYTLEQGVEMGRPSLINIQLGKRDGQLVHGGIGGKAVLMGQGILDLDWTPSL